MSDVQIQISNTGDCDVVVRKSTSSPTTLHPLDKPEWFPVKEGSNIAVKYSENPTLITVDIIDGGQASQPQLSQSQVALKVYKDSPAFIEAKTGMLLELHVIVEAPDDNDEDSFETSSEGVKCGEIIIYPPA